VRRAVTLSILIPEKTRNSAVLLQANYRVTRSGPDRQAIARSGNRNVQLLWRTNVSNPPMPPDRLDNIRLHIRYVPPGDLKNGFRATKRHSARQIRKLATSIQENGFLVPVMVNDELEILAGYARVEAAKLAKLDEIPVISVSHLSRAEQRLFAIFDNKIATEGTIDLDAVALELGDIILEEPDTILTDSGFEIAEIDLMFNRTRTAELDDLDEIPMPASDPVTRPGDTWCIGRHRITCGDATDPEVIATLVNGQQVRAVISDAPYNISIPGVVSGKGAVRHENFAMASGEMSEAEFVRFLSSFIDAARPHLVDGALALVFMDWRHIAELIAAAKASGLLYRQLLVWAKSSPAMGGVWRNGHELIGVFRQGDQVEIDNVQLGRFGRNRSNVLHYPGVNVFGKGRKRALAMHPTVKPVALVADLMLDVTKPGDLILDSFGGSGTTLVAAHAVDRTACLCEIDPGYVDATLERWLRRQSEMPILEATGETFVEVATQRRAEDAPVGKGPCDVIS
jgi:DNA modification methylase